jgi:hypothetical protein
MKITTEFGPLRRMIELLNQNTMTDCEIHPHDVTGWVTGRLAGNACSLSRIVPKREPKWSKIESTAADSLRVFSCT